MSNFTKGEWTITEKPKSSGMCSTSTGHFDIETNDIHSFITVENETRCESKANAHLIAAAPDMYKLLQKFLPMDADGNGWDFVYDEGSEHMGEDVIALLAKARGEL